MNYSTDSIAQILDAPTPSINRTVSILLTDSRSLTFAGQTLFFALRTSTGNGHRYIPGLYAKGVGLCGGRASRR